MTKILRAASIVAVIISAAGTFVATDPGFASDSAAAAQLPVLTINRALAVDPAAPAEGIAPAPGTPPIQTPIAPAPSAALPIVVQQAAAPAKLGAGSLAELVRKMPQPGQLDAELACLAGTIYFESKGESLAGQLAVGEVVLNRAASGRFPRTVCGVVYQRSQFSFVRGGAMPYINKASTGWREALAIAQIARDDLWDSPVEGALFFHAARVLPGWRLKRLAQVDNHIFYR